MARKRKNSTKGSNSIADVNKSQAVKSQPKNTFQSFPLHLVPELAECHLTLRTLHPSTVWTIPNFLSTSECKKWIDFSEQSGGFEYTAHPATNYIAHRECYRMQENNATELSSLLYRRLESSGVLPRLQRELAPFFPKHLGYGPVGCNPNIRLYKYTKGHSFGKHVDGSNDVDGMGHTEITVLVYLSSCRGGATRFHPGRKKKSFGFDPEPGTMLLHVHGDNCLEHEADEVLDGVKYVLRTDIVFSAT